MPTQEMDAEDAPCDRARLGVRESIWTLCVLSLLTVLLIGAGCVAMIATGGMD